MCVLRLSTRVNVRIHTSQWCIVCFWRAVNRRVDGGLAGLNCLSFTATFKLGRAYLDAFWWMDQCDANRAWSTNPSPHKAQVKKAPSPVSTSSLLAPVTHRQPTTSNHHVSPWQQQLKHYGHYMLEKPGNWCYYAYALVIKVNTSHPLYRLRNSNISTHEQ